MKHMNLMEFVKSRRELSRNTSRASIMQTYSDIDRFDLMSEYFQGWITSFDRDRMVRVIPSVHTKNGYFSVQPGVSPVLIRKLPFMFDSEKETPPENSVALFLLETTTAIRESELNRRQKR